MRKQQTTWFNKKALYVCDYKAAFFLNQNANIFNRHGTGFTLKSRSLHPLKSHTVQEENIFLPALDLSVCMLAHKRYVFLCLC